MRKKLLEILLSPLSLFMQWLAQENILFTTVKEGTIKTIMRGKKFERFYMAFEGFHLNDPTKKSWAIPNLNQPGWEVLYHGKDNPYGFVDDMMNDSFYDDRSWLLKRLGLYWVGWPWANSVYIYRFEWNEYYTEQTSGKEKVLPRAEPTDFIYVSDFPYVIVTDGAETMDRLPTDEQTLITVAVRNPYRALFSVKDWMQRITGAINRNVRNFVGRKNYQDLISSRNWAGFSAPIIKLNKKLPDDKQGTEPWGLLGKYGIEIRTADLQSIELSGIGKVQNQEAATKVYSATQEAEAIGLKGKAEAGVIKMKGDTEAEALRARLAVIKEHGEAGIALAGYDAIQASSGGPGNTIIWANNPLASLVGLLKPEKSIAKEGEKP